jgi:predicted component of type VI protein secretion system
LLEQEFNKDVGFTFSKKSRYWDYFHEKFKPIADEVESTSNSRFAEQFRQHYEAQIVTFYADKFKQ